MTKRGMLQICLSAAFVVITLLSSSAIVCRAQTRDHFTPQEVELIQEAQILDKRIDIFIRAIDRRILSLNGGATESSAKQLKKESEKWGELPTGTRAELLGDVAKILNEAITNIDDVSSRDEKNPLIPKALRKLAAAATQTVERLKPLQAHAKDDAETMGFEQLVNHAEEIVAAAGALPPPAEKKGKNKTEKPKETN